jgi:hypothetical protein
MVKGTEKESRVLLKEMPQRGGGPKMPLLSQFKMFSVCSVVVFDTR